MKRLILLCLCLLPLNSDGGKRFVIWNSLDPDVAIYKANVITNGGTVSDTTLAALSAMVVGLKSDGVWAKIQELYPFCGDDLTAARTKLKYVTASSLLANGGSFVSGDYTETGSTGGLKGNGTSKYLDSGFNPVTQSSSESSFHVSAYVKGTETAGSSRAIIGNYNGSTLTGIGWFAAGSFEGGLIAASAGVYAGSSISKEGFLAVSANGSRTNTYYFNGSAVGSTVVASASFLNLSIFVSAFNNSGAPGLIATRYLRLISIGTGLSSTDATNFYNRVQAFETALSRNL